MPWQVIVCIIACSIVCVLLFGSWLGLVIYYQRRIKEFENQEHVESAEEKHIREEREQEDVERALALRQEFNEWNDKIFKATRTLAETEELVEQQKAELAGLLEQISKNHGTLEEYAEKLRVAYAELFESTKKKTELEQEIARYQLEAVRLHTEEEAICASLMELKERHRLALVRDATDGELWDMKLSDRDVRLMKVLRDIESEYAEFASDLASIEWKSIWLPQLQDMVSQHDLNGETGIYMLVLKSDDSIRYVGQAVDIKMRWYDHVKKMLGIVGKGAEKLYRYKPEDFYWTVIERKPKNLNAAEEYWIDFYGCREKGLNKK